MSDHLVSDVVFYSWQSDLANATNRGLIEAALQKAAKAIRRDDSIVIEPRVDADTRGVSGAPDIAQEIRRKIESASVFVADVSLVTAHGWLSRLVRSKRTPNPNVLIELGYAQHAIGDDRIVLVCNEAYGAIEALPFDIRGRRVVGYKSRPRERDRATARNKLSKVLEMRLREIVDAPAPITLDLQKVAKSRATETEHQAYFRLKNDGSRDVRSPTVTLRLSDGVTGAKMGGGWLVEHQADTFESGGRVAIAKPMETGEPLLVGHHVDFYGLKIPEAIYPIGTELILDFQISGQDYRPTRGHVRCIVTGDDQ